MVVSIYESGRQYLPRAIYVNCIRGGTARRNGRRYFDDFVVDDEDIGFDWADMVFFVVEEDRSIREQNR
jgi:hypothetical protein